MRSTEVFAAERDREGTDLVARMIAARPAALLCSDAAQETFPDSNNRAPAGRESGGSTYAASADPA